MTSTPAPSPSTHTLFLKSHKLTTLLYALPSTSLHTIKSELFTLLHENAQNLSIPLPSDPDDIVLGASIDSGISRGWHVISGQERKKTTVQDAGLKDGDAVAWRCKVEERFVVSVPVEEEEEEEGEGGMEE
ncbi:hypothetical protein K440DRAFT_641650 [Wilcoxina mikolae CBS 423.85]|nr:hypothetical protein K440DRAFT_641650 [Wilcoxina mikolae CBS 423.85]